MSLIEMAKKTFGSGSRQHIDAIAFELGDLAKELAAANDKVFRRRFFGLLLPSATKLREVSEHLILCRDYIASLESELLDIDEDNSDVDLIDTFRLSLDRSFQTLIAVAQMMEEQWNPGTNRSAADLNAVIERYNATEQARLRNAIDMNARFTSGR